jgi:hypothetical protein
MMADYNGWADQPEEEREALDQLVEGWRARISAGRVLPSTRLVQEPDAPFGSRPPTPRSDSTPRCQVRAATHAGDSLGSVKATADPSFNLPSPQMLPQWMYCLVSHPALRCGGAISSPSCLSNAIAQREPCRGWGRSWEGSVENDAKAR